MTALAFVFAIIALVAMRRARHCHGYYGYGWHGPFGHDHHDHWGGWHGRRHARARMMLRALFMRIDATPAQERAIVAQVEKLQDRLRAAKAGMHDARGDLAAALRGPLLDDAALGAVLGRVDTATGEARSALVEALRGVHDVLDDRQRSQVADLLDRGHGGWWRGFGPYR